MDGQKVTCHALLLAAVVVQLRCGLRECCTPNRSPRLDPHPQHNPAINLNLGNLKSTVISMQFCLRAQDMVKDVGARRVFTVFGCEGDVDKEKRPVLGEIAHFKARRRCIDSTSAAVRSQCRLAVSFDAADCMRFARVLPCSVPSDVLAGQTLLRARPLVSALTSIILDQAPTVTMGEARFPSVLLVSCCSRTS